MSSIKSPASQAVQPTQVAEAQRNDDVKGPGSESDSQPDSQPDVQNENNNEKKNEDEINFNLKFWTIMAAIYITVFLVALDRMIIATAIPSITDEFHSIEDIGWYGSAYMLTAAIFNLLFGRIYQLYNTKWVYLISLVIFEAGSALCGAAPSSSSFIVGRAIAGIGAAGIFIGGIMIIIPLVPLSKRPVFTSFFGMAFGVSSVLGPLIGGSFTDNSKLTWRWCFYINLPIGGFSIIAMLLFLRLDSPQYEKVSLWKQLTRLDPLGCLFFIPSMVCLVLALQWGGTTYPWSEPKIIGLLVTFAVTFIIFLLIETFLPKTAMAPPRVVLNRSVAGAMLYMLLIAGVMMTVIYYLAIWFQAAQGQSAMQAGIRTIPFLISFVILAIGSAGVTQRIGYYNPALLIAPIFCSVGSGMLSTLTPSSGANEWIGYQVILGIGIGFGFQTCSLPPQAVLSASDVPLGMGLIFFMQQLGGAIFIAVAQNLFSSNLIESLSGIAGLDAQAIVNTGATALRGVVPANELSIVINAYSHALTRTFVMAAGLSVCLILGAAVLEWKSIKAKKDPTQEESQSEATSLTEIELESKT